jgi:hypothetical protein
MSHLTRVRTTLTDPALLAAALRATGYAGVEVHERPVPLRSPYGWQADAEVVVRQAANPPVRHDFGFARRADGCFEMVVDGMEQGRYGSRWQARLAQAYGHAAALRYAADNGYEVATDEVEQDGTRRLTLRRVT